MASNILCFEDYESKESLQVINQMVGEDATMQQDEKETSQLAAKRQVELWSRASKFLYFCSHAVYSLNHELK